MSRIERFPRMYAYSVAVAAHIAWIAALIYTQLTCDPTVFLGCLIVDALIKGGFITVLLFGVVAALLLVVDWVLEEHYQERDAQ